MMRTPLMQNVHGHVDIIRHAAEQAAQLESEADTTLTATTLFEERTFHPFRSRSELEAVIRQTEGRERYLTAGFDRDRRVLRSSEATLLHDAFGKDMLQRQDISHIHPDGTSNLPSHSQAHSFDAKSLKIVELQQNIAQLQAELDTISTQHTKSQRRNEKHFRELSNLRNVAEDGKYYKQESIAMQKKLEYEQRKTNTLQHEVSRLRGMVDGLRDGEIRHLREERDAVRMGKPLNIYIGQKDLHGVYKQVVRWSRGDYRVQPNGGDDSRPLISSDIEMQTFPDPPSVPYQDMDVFPRPVLPGPVEVHQPGGLFRRTRSKLGSKSSKHSALSSVSTTSHYPLPILPAPNLNPHWQSQHTHTTAVKISIRTDFERRNNILSPYLKSEFFSDPIKRECVLDLGMSWQTKLHQAPKCLYMSYRAKSGEWSARERREGSACRNCRVGTWWPEGVLRQCVRLNSRDEIEILNPRPWDLEKQEIYDRANWARGTGVSLEEVGKIEDEILRLGGVGGSAFGLQIAGVVGEMGGPVCN